MIHCANEIWTQTGSATRRNAQENAPGHAGRVHDTCPEGDSDTQQEEFPKSGALRKSHLSRRVKLNLGFDSFSFVHRVDIRMLCRPAERIQIIVGQNDKEFSETGHRVIKNLSTAGWLIVSRKFVTT